MPPTQALSVFAYGYTVLSFLFFYRKSTLEFINLISVCNFTGLFFFGLDSPSWALANSGYVGDYWSNIKKSTFNSNLIFAIVDDRSI